MRDILFRGKVTDGDKWVYGDYEYNPAKDIARIHTYDVNGTYISQFIVDKETVGQYTGLDDKNGNKIFEGDIVKRTEIPFGLEDIGVVVFNVEKGCYGIEVEKYGYTSHLSFVKNGRVIDGYCTMEWTAEFEVIGNIHDDTAKKEATNDKN